jgi:hypothetical protein
MIWSSSHKVLIPIHDNHVSFGADDLIFLYDNGLVTLFESQEAIEQWFQKILRHFASEGLDAVVTMLQNELNFLSKKQHIEQDICILCFQAS